MGHLSGNGYFTKRCQELFENRLGGGKCLMTTSCTDALEMAALLLNIGEGDEVIVPSFTFVSTALAFAREGARIVFADSRRDHPGMDESDLESLITPRTKAIVPVHYAGVACDMDIVMKLAEKHGIYVVEDAAHAIGATFKGRPLGSIGHIAAFSFHETKNIHCGEGGMLVVNDPSLFERAEILWEKGTNRSQFFKGEVDKYEWVDTGSSFLASDISAAFLYAQLQAFEDIQRRRCAVWRWYDLHIEELFEGVVFQRPFVPDYADQVAHMYYIVFESTEERDFQIERLSRAGMHSIFHYRCLHQSKMGRRFASGVALRNAERYDDCLLRLPLHCHVTEPLLESVLEDLAGRAETEVEL